MLTLTIVTILGGAVLGLRYKIFILLPAATFMLVFGVGIRRCARSWHLEDRAGYDGRHDGPAAGLRRRKRVCCGAGALQEWSYSHQPARSSFSSALNFRPLRNRGLGGAGRADRVAARGSLSRHGPCRGFPTRARCGLRRTYARGQGSRTSQTSTI